MSSNFHKAKSKTERLGWKQYGWLWGKGQEPSAHLNVHLLPQDLELLSLPESLLRLLIPQWPEIGLHHTVGLQHLQFLKSQGPVLFRWRSNLDVVFYTVRRAHHTPPQTPACLHRTSMCLHIITQVCIPLHEGSPKSSVLTQEKQAPMDKKNSRAEFQLHWNSTVPKAQSSPDISAPISSSVLNTLKRIRRLEALGGSHALWTIPWALLSLFPSKNAGCHQEGLALPGLEWCHQYLVIPEHAVCNLKEKAQKGGSKRTGLATCGYTFKHTTSAVTKANYLHLYYHTKLTSPPH